MFGYLIYEIPIMNSNPVPYLSIVHNTIRSPFHTPILLSCFHTFFVPVLNVGSPCNKDRHELLVSSCTRQRQRCVMITLRLQGRTTSLNRVVDFCAYMCSLALSILRSLSCQIGIASYMCIYVNRGVEGQD